MSKDLLPENHNNYMKFEITDIGISPETTVMQDIIEVIDGVETVTGQEKTDDYDVIITVGIKSDNNIIPDFSKGIKVRSNNALTGFEVDAQRDQAVNDFVASINE